MKFTRNFIFILVCLVCGEFLHSHAQTLYKAAHPPLPNAVKPISKNELLKAGCLSKLLFHETESDSSIYVASYTMTFTEVGKDQISNLSTSDTFPSGIFGFLISSNPGAKVIFSKIILYSDSAGAKQKLYPPSLAYSIVD